MQAMLPRPAAGVLLQSVADGAVLLDTRSEVYFGLNAVGARIWRLLPPATHTLDELCEAVCAAYPDAPPATVRTDVAGVLRALEDAGLVRPHARRMEVDDASALAGPSA
jgi:hypothetical protein